MCYTIMNIKETPMLPTIYNIEDFEEFLSECAIGTEKVQHLTDYVRRLEQRNRYQSKRLDTAANLIGHQTITECMMDEDYE